MKIFGLFRCVMLGYTLGLIIPHRDTFWRSQWGLPLHTDEPQRSAGYSGASALHAACTVRQVIILV